MVYQCEKTLAESGAKLSADEKTTIESAIDKVKKAMEGDNLAELKTAVESLTQAFHQASASLYKTSNEQPTASEQANEKAEENVVDADFEEVNN